MSQTTDNFAVKEDIKLLKDHISDKLKEINLELYKELKETDSKDKNAKSIYATPLCDICAEHYDTLFLNGKCQYLNLFHLYTFIILFNLF